MVPPLCRPPPTQGSAVFDFSGSGPEVYGNCNAPRAITLSALIYCLRCMVGQDIPLNQVGMDPPTPGTPLLGQPWAEGPSHGAPPWVMDPQLEHPQAARPCRRALPG